MPISRLPRPVLLGALGLVGLSVVTWLFLRSVDRTREQAAELDRVVVEVEELSPPSAPGVTLWLSNEPSVDVEPFDGKVYAATSAGLEVLGTDGVLARRYTTLDGLPENTLTCLERFEGKLYIGTRGGGLLAFDGTRFVRYGFTRPAASYVTALRTIRGELVIGTFDAGTFEFDGETFTRRYAAAAGRDFVHVTALLEAGPRVYAGTFESGLVEWREGQVVRIGDAEGLPSKRVTALAAGGESVYVATDLGVARIASDGLVEPVDGTANVTGVAVADDRVLVSSLTRGLVVADPGRLASSAPAASVARSGLGVSIDATSVLGLKVEDASLWAMTTSGLFVSTGMGGTPRLERFDRSPPSSGLTAGHVSALALDATGRLWVGLFDGGVDILDPRTGARLERVEDADLHEVNAILADARRDRVWVASSKGLALFDGGKKTRMLAGQEGLVGENVAGIAVGDEGSIELAAATNAGVSLFGGPVARSLTAFHGLPNNHTYAVALMGGRTYVGTLGGLAEIEGLRVGRVFTASDSRLPHNWVSALASDGRKLYVGTYGGGVVTLYPSGEIVPAAPTKNLDVNPGAMAVVDGRLYVGTLGAGAYLMDIDSGRWTRATAGLSSLNVTAVAADDTYVYFGTEHGITRVERAALS
jgi:hypothetical protein